MKAWYSSFVEHYFRVAFKEPETLTDGALVWFRTVKSWLSTISYLDQHFLYKIFTSTDYSMKEIMPKLPGKESANWRRLWDLERSFAQYSGLM